MGRLVSRSGKVSRISYEVFGVRDGAEVPRHPAYQLDFLIDDRPARFQGHPIVGDGDFVTVAGFESDGVLTAIAIRNRSTGVDYGGPSPFLYIGSALTLVAGLLTLRSGLGVLFIALSGWLAYRVRRTARALSMVRSLDP